MTENDSTDRALAGAGGDDMSAGTSVSGVGGEVNRTANEDAGLSPVEERAAEVAWGRDVAEGAEQPVAVHDGTGQSEKPSD
jgi:hypothetical protein